MIENNLVDEDYWPYPLRNMRNEDPIASERVIVAEISKPWGSGSIRKLTTALAPPELVDEIVANPDQVGVEVITSGPHPSASGSSHYVPSFSVYVGKSAPDGLEPLVVSWQAGPGTILLPDQGFLMTYGLVPRIRRSDDGDFLHWDDMERPYHDVVISKMVSEYYFELKSEAMVCIDCDYLQDYATLRNRVLTQIFYAMNADDLVPDDRKALSGKNAQEFKLKGRYINICVDTFSESKLIAQIWGVRPIFFPKNSPITKGRWDYGSLSWPGIEGKVTKERSRKLGFEHVYIDDAVLQYYEERSGEYFVHPESGGVSFGGQWSAGYCRRVSRDVIQLEIRKLYEGCPPEVVKHWHDYAVDPPSGTPVDLMRVPNVATRSKRIVYSLVDFGDTLANVANRIVTLENFTSQDFVRLNRERLDYYGWWKDPNASPIARQISKDMGESQFLVRCESLCKLVVEGLNERKIRRTIAELGVSEDKMKGLRGLKLLDILIQYAIICQETGLDLFRDSQELEKRWLEKKSNLETGQHLPTPIDKLFLLYDLRQESAHRGGNMDELLGKMGTNRSSVKAGMGELLDRLYDSIANALEKTAELIRQCLT